MLVAPMSSIPWRIDVPTRVSHLRAPEELSRELDALEQRFPRWVRRAKIGETHERRPIEALFLGARPGTPGAQTLLITAGAHPRETSNGVLLTDWATDLLTRAATGDAARDALLGARTIVLVPSLNPDGAARVWEGLGSGVPKYIWWRTNAAPTGGVDLNRNFPGPSWGAGSTIPGHTNYRGPAPGSEPETRALVQFAAALRPDAVYDVHSAGGVVLMPEPRAAASDARAAANVVARATGYRVTTSDAHWSGKVGGTLKDWAHDELGVPSLTIETGSVHHQSDQIYADTRERMFRALDALTATVDGRARPPQRAERLADLRHPARPYRIEEHLQGVRIGPRPSGPTNPDD